MTQHVPEGYEKSIDPASVDDAVDVVCDDPGHARGKVARLEKFVRVDGYWRPWPRVVATIKHLPGHGAPAPTPAALHDYRRPDGTPRHRYECELCGLSFVGTDATIVRLLDLLAARGVSQVNLKALNLLASKKF